MSISWRHPFQLDGELKRKAKVVLEGLGRRKHMGLTIARVKVYNPRDESRNLDLELLIDTGSTYTWIRRGRLEGLGIMPVEKVRFKTIDNRIIERFVAEAIVECMGRKATTIVVFAEENDNEVLGVHALEGLRLEVDPATRQLKEVEAVLAL